MVDKITLINDSPAVRYSLEDVVDTSSIKTCSWWKDLPLFNNARSVKDFISNLDKLYSKGAGKTVKVCPGIKNLLQNTLVIKTPVDIAIKVRKLENDYQLFFNVADEELAKNFINTHPTWQFTSQNNKHLKNKVNIKIQLPFSMHSKDAHCIFLDPFYHSDNEIKVVPGTIIFNKKLDSIPLNINFFVDLVKEDRDIFIPNGTPIAYIYFFRGVSVNDRISDDKPRVNSRPLQRSFTNNNFY